MKLFKRNAIILTVVMFLCVAVYLNWSYNKSHSEDGSPDAIDASLENEIENIGESGLIYQEDTGLSQEVSDYFYDARLARQQARDSAISMLQEASQTEGATQESIDMAVNEITAMASYSLSEAEIEALIKAKGFADCVVFLEDDSATVAVPAPQEGLSTSAVSRITDIILSETDLTAEQIKIIEIK